MSIQCTLVHELVIKLYLPQTFLWPVHRHELEGSNFRFVAVRLPSIKADFKPAFINRLHDEHVAV